MIKYIIDSDPNAAKPYILLNAIKYKSKRYNKEVHLDAGMRSDGATGAFDIISEAWWVHDKLCNTGVFADGTPCTNLQASTILSDILRSEGHWFRSISWFITTLALGGGKARDNGIWKL